MIRALVTWVDVVERVDASFSARLDAVLADGRRVVVLDDRGWTTALRSTGGGALPDVWSTMTAEEVRGTARDVVGPDDDGPEGEASYWAFLADILRRQGVDVAADDLRRVPHEVVLSDRVLARLG